MAEQTPVPNEQQAGSNESQEVKKEEEKVDFKSLSLEDMEAALETEKLTPEEVKEVEDVIESELSEDEDSVDSKEEVVEEEKEDSKNQTSKEKEETKSEKSEKSFDVEKAYKELQAEFTRRSQELKQLKTELEELKSPKKSAQSEAEEIEDRFAQLKKQNPNAAKFIDDLQQAVDEMVGKRLKEKVSPIEERVTLRTRQENLEKFDRDMKAFQNSELKDLEPEVVAIYNSEPSLWQRLIFDSDNAFQQLLNRAVIDNLDKVVELKGRKKQVDSTNTSKKKMIDKAQVGKPSGSSKTISETDFKDLSLEDMEKALPKAD